MRPQDNDEDLIELSNNRIDIAEQYAEAREKHSRIFSEIRLLLSLKIKEYQAMKKNIGFDMALLNFLADSGEGIRADFKEMEIAQAKYKGAEKILEAIESKQMSIMNINKITQGAVK